MHFGTPLLVLLLLAFVPIAAALVGLSRWRRVAVRGVAHIAQVGQASSGRRTLKLALVLGALALLAVAAARPQRGSRRVLLPREGTDVMIALDVSASMLATDIEPNRFERAKAILSSLLDRLQGDRVGLVVFAGTASQRFPLTTDVSAARELIKNTVIKEGGLAAGTGIGDGIRAAATSFGPNDGQKRGKIIVLVSDGEDLAGSPQDAVRTARDRGVQIWTMGIGTDAGGPIIVPRPSGTPQARIDSSTGEPATSQRNETVLRQLAQAGGGEYVDGNQADPAARIADGIGKLDRARFESQEGSLPIERYQIFAVGALVLLAADFLLSESRVRRVRRGIGLRRRSQREAA